MNKLKISVILFVLIFSVAAHAFVIGNPDYRIDGVVSTGGGKIVDEDTNQYVSYLSVGQPVITINSTSGLYIKGGGYNLCLGIFCTGVFEKPYYLSISGWLEYDTGQEVANSDANIIVSYNQETYRGKTIKTDDEGKFTANVTIPDRIAKKDFIIEVYTKGRIEAEYKCKYDPGNDRCDEIK